MDCGTIYPVLALLYFTYVSSFPEGGRKKGYVWGV